MIIYLCSPGSDQSQTLARLLRQYTQHRIVGVLFEDETRFISRNIDEFVSYRDLDNLPGDGLILPTGARSTQFMLERGDVTCGSVVLTRDALRVFDKPWIIALAAACRVPTPITWLRVEDIGDYPAFFKELRERGGGRRGIARQPAEIPASGRDELIYQEYIDSPGTYGVGFIARRGEILTSHAHFEAISIPPSGGSAVALRSIADPRLDEYARRIIAQLGYSGWGLVEFKYCPKRDDYVFMEVNAKFWASLELALANQPLFAELLFGIETPEQAIVGMVFLNRYLQRGLLFAVRNLPLLLRPDTRLSVYPGLLKSFILGLVPERTSQLLHRLVRRFWKKPQPGGASSNHTP